MKGEKRGEVGILGVLSIIGSILCIVGGILVILLPVPDYESFEPQPTGYTFFWNMVVRLPSIVIGVLAIIGGFSRVKYRLGGYILCVIMGFVSIPLFRHGLLYGAIITFIGGFSGVVGFLLSRRKEDLSGQ
jgi:hypothetical protein